MTKLGLKQVPGVTRVTIRKSKNILFVIAVVVLSKLLIDAPILQFCEVNFLNFCGMVTDASLNLL